MNFFETIDSQENEKDEKRNSFKLMMQQIYQKEEKQCDLCGKMDVQIIKETFQTCVMEIKAIEGQ